MNKAEVFFDLSKRIRDFCRYSVNVIFPSKVLSTNTPRHFIEVLDSRVTFPFFPFFFLLLF